MGVDPDGMAETTATPSYVTGTTLTAAASPRQRVTLELPSGEDPSYDIGDSGGQ
jgi:hypothetical protein